MEIAPGSFSPADMPDQNGPLRRSGAIFVAPKDAEATGRVVPGLASDTRNGTQERPGLRSNAGALERAKICEWDLYVLTPEPFHNAMLLPDT